MINKIIYHTKTILNKVIAFVVILVALLFFTIYGITLAVLNIIVEYRKEVSNE
jgi:hypothetical protein